MAKPKKKKTLSDYEYIKRFLANGESQAALARELGVSSSAVSQRTRKLAEAIATAKASGENATVAGMVASAHHILQSEHFSGGLDKIHQQYHIFDHLESLFMDIKSLTEDVKRGIDAERAKGKTAKGFQIDQVVKLVNQSRSLVVDAHKIKMDLAQARNVETYIQVITSIVMKYDPDIKRKLYAELAGLGLEGQIAFVTAGSRSPSGGRGNS